MKKIMYIMCCFPLFVLADLDIVKITDALRSIEHEKPLKFFNNNQNIALEKKLNFTTLSEADIVLFPMELNSSKLLIVDSYSKLKSQKKSIGAIYSIKGRTQIIFIEERFNENNLDLPNKFNKYLISECQLSLTCLVTKYLNSFKI